MEDFRLIYDFQAERSLIGAMLIAPEKVIPEAALSFSFFIASSYSLLRASFSSAASSLEKVPRR